MGGKVCLGVAALGMLVSASLPAMAADTVPAHVDAAKAAYQKGDLPRAARELEGALAELHERMGHSLAEALPNPPPGWEADQPEIQGLGQLGGGLSVTRGYNRGDTSLNASLILDSPAVDAAAALLANPTATTGQPNVRRVKVGNEDALVRYDSANKAGEITLVLGNRVLLEIEGDNLSSADLLLDTAKNWNVAKIRSLIGL